MTARPAVPPPRPWRTAGVLLCLWALLSGQALALWHQHAHPPSAQTDAWADAGIEHEVGAQCALLDELLGLATAPGVPGLPRVRPVACEAGFTPRAQCLPAAARAFEARAPPRG